MFNQAQTFSEFPVANIAPMGNLQSIKRKILEKKLKQVEIFSTFIGENAGTGPLGYYPDRVAKSYNGHRAIHWNERVKDTESLASDVTDRGCNMGFRYGLSEDGHTYVKRMYCQREYCSTCFRNGSIAHRRRVARLYKRWYNHVHGWHTMIFTIPAAWRERMGKKQLSGGMSYIRRKFKRDYPGIKGEMRWHFGGDQDHGMTWEPHLNVTIDWCWLEPEYIDELKVGWLQTMRKVCDVQDFEPEETPNMQSSYIEIGKRYRTRSGKWIHWDAAAAFRLRYIYRATYRGKSETHRATLKGFRNNRIFGWEGIELKEVESKSEATKVLTSQKIIWQKGIMTYKDFLEFRRAPGVRYIKMALWTNKPEEPPVLQSLEKSANPVYISLAIFGNKPPPE
jgi:hypothetical protein